MTSLRLTDTDREALAFLALAEGEGLTLARDVAVELGWNPRTAGPRLRRLVRLRLVEAKVVREPTARSDRLDGYALTARGREAIGGRFVGTPRQWYGKLGIVMRPGATLAECEEFMVGLRAHAEKHELVYGIYDNRCHS